MSEEIKQATANEYFWVPEGAMFDCASDCLGKFPDMGPACLVASHTHYHAAIKRENKLKNKVLKLGYYYDLSRRGGFAGQALTNYVCAGCDVEFTHHNTATPILCINCETKAQELIDQQNKQTLGAFE